MKRLKSNGNIIIASMALLLSSCGGNGSETKEDTMTSDSSAMVETPAPVSTVDLNPVNMMIVKFKVADFAKWKTGFEGNDSLRLANGIHKYVVGRGEKDTSMVLVANKVDDLEKAKTFGKSSAIKEAMKKGGVIGAPTMMFVTTAFQDTANLSTNLRSITTFTVKDWDAWKTSFEGSRQLRLDNGLTDRVYSHDADDNKKVSLVVAIMDTAKANAFWKSDTLKQQRAKSGVVGEPQRFIFRIVAKY
jgi:hypothetical protein